MALGGLSVGTAFVDILPNTSKFGSALTAETSAATSGVAQFQKAAVLGLGIAGAASIKLAADFDASMRNVNSIAQLPEKQFQSLSDSVLALAGPTAQAPKTLADGLYDLVSSGFDAKESLTILEASAYAATAGLTTTDVASKGVAAVLNAYRLPASKAAQVSDVLFRTVDKGVLTFEELSTGIGDTLPFAASLGVSLKEVGAATATMTKQGLSSSETFTRIRNLLQTMIKPGEDLQNAFKELGVASGEELIHQKGLQGALEAVIKTTDGSKEAVGKLFPNIRSLGGALALTGDNADSAQKDLKAFGDVSGATQKALEQQSKSTNYQLKQLSANLQVIGIKLGQTLLPPINEIVSLLNKGLMPAFEALQSPIGRFITGFGTPIKGLVMFVKANIAAFKLLGSTVASFASGAAQKIVAFAGTMRDLATSALPVLLAVFRRLRIIGAATWNGIKVAASTAFRVIRTAFAPLIAWISANLRNLRALGGLAFRAIGAVARAIFAQIKAEVAVMRAVASAAFNALRAAGAAAFHAVLSVAAPVFRTILSVGSSVLHALASVFGTLKGVGVSVFNAIAAAVRAVVAAVQAAISAVQSLTSAVGSALSSVGSLIDKVGDLPGNIAGKIPFLQHGGAATAGHPYIVGERGPELFVPARSGVVLPNSALRAAPGAGGIQGRITITNWHTGAGYFQSIAASEDMARADFDRQRDAMLR